MALPEGLLDAVRNDLNITWEDAETDKKISGYIARGMQKINKLLGSAQTYDTEDYSYELLLNYCIYARSDSLNDFFINYAEAIKTEQQYIEIQEYLDRLSGDST
jgi:hypothetical protein